MRRRMFLTAAGVSLGLPVLESLLPREARAGAGSDPKRFLALFFPNGTTQRSDWSLGGTGSNYTMGTAHTSLEPFRSQVSMFTGLDVPVGGSPDHSRGTAAFLTGATISDQNVPQVATSIDQAIADDVSPNTMLRSLHLGPNPYPGDPPSDTGWPSGYNTFISWSSANNPNAPLESAQVAFDQVYVPDGSDPGAAAKRIRLRQSILDSTLEQIDTISPRLGSVDSARLDQYLTAVREIESQLQDVPPPATGCGAGEIQPEVGLAFGDHTKAMLDIIALAFECDATRFITYSMDYGFGNKDFSFIGVPKQHHNLTHNPATPEILDWGRMIVRWYMDQLAYLLGRLSGDGVSPSVLDDSIILMGSGVADGWSHAHNDAPVILAGGGGGALTPGRLIDANGVPYDDVLLGVAHAMDAPLESFGTSSTPFSGL